MIFASFDFPFHHSGFRVSVSWRPWIQSPGPVMMNGPTESGLLFLGSFT